MCMCVCEVRAFKSVYVCERGVLHHLDNLHVSAAPCGYDKPN